MRIEVIESCRLQAPRIFMGSRAVVDGGMFRAMVGAWAFYIPRLNAKILHSVDGNCHCIHAHAPARDRVFDATAVIRGSRYSLGDWRRAYARSAARRAAENYVAALRLYRCGLGPNVTGCVVVKNFEPYYGRGACRSFGILVDDLRGYPRRTRATAEQIEAAGVIVDRSRSCLRQQIRGYVSDLNSTVGVMPVDAEAEVRQIERQLEHACGPGQ